MADLSSYFQVAPVPAAFMLGQQQALANDQTQTETSRLQALTQGLNISNDQAQQMNPLLVQHQGLTNKNLEAQIPGTQADAAQKQLDLSTAQQTQSSKIAKMLSDDHLATVKNNSEELVQKSKALSVVGAALASGQGQVNGPGSAINLPALLKANGLDPNDPYVQAVVGHSGGLGYNPQQLGQHIYEVGQQTLKLSEPYLQATDTEDKKAASAKVVANIDASSRANVANIDAASREKVANIRATQIASTEAQFAKIHDPLNRDSFARDQYQQAVNTGDDAQAIKWWNRVQANLGDANMALKARVAGKADLDKTTNGRVPNASAELTMPPRPGLTPPPTDEPKMDSVTEKLLQSQVEKAGQKYQPDLYDYKVENGKVLRRPKSP